jgi:NodT family efflux transporter outer membrane factor (OMF) lipoprotein
MRAPPALLVLLLAGCTVGPDHRAPELPAAPAWSAAAEAGTPTGLAGWWRRFGDPTLTTLVERGVAASPSAAEAAARVREARASLAGERAGDWPSLDASLSAERRATPSGSFGGFALPGGARTANSFAAGFDAAFELDLFGGRRRSQEAAAARLGAADAEFGSALLTLVGDVARNYVEARGAQARIAVARDTLALRRGTAALTRGRARAGLTSELDAMRAEAEAEGAEAAIPPLQTSLANAVNRLAALTGATGQEISSLLAAPAPVPRLAEGVVPDPPAAVLARRPDVAQAERQLAAASAEIGVAEAARYPALTLAGSLGVNAARLRGATLQNAQAWSFGPSLDLPVFDAGRRRATVEERRAARDARAAAWRSTVLTAIEEVENAMAALAAERRRNAAQRRTVAAYEGAERLARAQYAAGFASFLDVLDAQRSLGSARDALVQSDTALSTGAIALFKALGGGWDAGR